MKKKKIKNKYSNGNKKKKISKTNKRNKFLKKSQRKNVKKGKIFTKIKKTIKVEAIPETAEKPYEMSHNPVMVREVLGFITGPDVPKRKVVIDGTLGLGGHAKALLDELPATVKYVAFDADYEHLKVAKKNLKTFKDQAIFVHNNFEKLSEELKNLKLKGIDVLLLDLGIASPHVDMPERGFSFLREGALDMRFDTRGGLTAADVVNAYPEKELIRIFKEYGEEPHARKIAREIIQRRKKKPFKTTLDLASVIEKLLSRDGRIHPATRIFQSLRIEVNHELQALENVLRQAVSLLRPQGRIVVISYHSLEDRTVKNFFREMAREYVNEEGKPTTTMLEPQLKIVTKKPLVPTEEEVKLNARSRSAKLRVAEKI